MEITVGMKFYPGFGDRPRPALRITARAQRRGPGGVLEEFVHTRTVDATYPTTWAAALEKGIRELATLKADTDPLWGGLRGVDPELQALRLVG